MPPNTHSNISEPGLRLELNVLRVDLWFPHLILLPRSKAQSVSRIPLHRLTLPVPVILQTRQSWCLYRQQIFKKESVAFPKMKSERRKVRTPRIPYLGSMRAFPFGPSGDMRYQPLLFERLRLLVWMIMVRMNESPRDFPIKRPGPVTKCCQIFLLVFYK